MKSSPPTPRLTAQVPPTRFLRLITALVEGGASRNPEPASPLSVTSATSGLQGVGLVRPRSTGAGGGAGSQHAMDPLPPSRVPHALRVSKGLALHQGYWGTDSVDLIT